MEPLIDYLSTLYRASPDEYKEAISVIVASVVALALTSKTARYSCRTLQYLRSWYSLSPLGRLVSRELVHYGKEDTVVSGHYTTPHFAISRNTGGYFVRDLHAGTSLDDLLTKRDKAILMKTIDSIEEARKHAANKERMAAALTKYK